MKQIKSFILFVFTLSEFRWWLWRAKTQLFDEEVEKYHLRALVLQIGEVIGVSAAATIILLNMAVNSPLDNVPIIERALPDTETIERVAQQPGPDFNTLAWCQDPQTKKDPAVAVQPEGEPRVILVRGSEQINWAGTPVSNTAVFSWATPDGQRPTEPVQMSDKAKQCFRDKSR